MQRIVMESVVDKSVGTIYPKNSSQNSDVSGQNWTVRWYYGNVWTYPWMDEIREGDFMVLDVSGVDAGLMGSENTLACVRKGVNGFVTGGGVRDADEIIMQKVPFWMGFISQSMVQGRLAYDSPDVAVCIGGVTVHPGAMVAADGDGVIVVPREIAADVARLAHEEHERDKKSRRVHYEALGREPDATV